MSSPCAIIFHGLAVFVKWNFIFNKWFKHFSVFLSFITFASDSFQAIYFYMKMKRERKGVPNSIMNQDFFY